MHLHVCYEKCSLEDQNFSHSNEKFWNHFQWNYEKFWFNWICTFNVLVEFNVFTYFYTKPFYSRLIYYRPLFTFTKRLSTSWKSLRTAASSTRRTSSSTSLRPPQVLVLLPSSSLTRELPALSETKLTCIYRSVNNK